MEKSNFVCLIHQTKEGEILYGIMTKTDHEYWSEGILGDISTEELFKKDAKIISVYRHKHSVVKHIKEIQKVNENIEFITTKAGEHLEDISKMIQGICRPEKNSEKNNFLLILHETDEDKLLYGVISKKDFEDWANGLLGDQMTRAELFDEQIENLTIFENKDDAIAWLKKIEETGAIVDFLTTEPKIRLETIIEDIRKEVFPEYAFTYDELYIKNIIEKIRSYISHLSRSFHNDENSQKVIHHDGKTYLKLRDVQFAKDLTKAPKNPIELSNDEKSFLPIIMNLHYAVEKEHYIKNIIHDTKALKECYDAIEKYILWERS